jgi:tRNA(Ile)-lysidine synthase TilS/MesJ
MLATDSFRSMQHHCSPYRQNSAFYPIISQIEHDARFSSTDTAEMKLDKLEEVLSEFGFDTSYAVPLFASLLSIPTKSSYLPLSFSPRQQKRVIPEGKTMCSLCSRLRRGVLYRVAAELGATKIALGHHRDDIVETLFLNLFFGGRLKAMAPKLLSDDGRHVVIRPLAYVAERDIARFARGRAFPLIPCKLCGSQENLQRRAVKQMLAAWEREFPGRTESIFSALRHLEPAHLADPRHFEFKRPPLL